METNKLALVGALAALLAPVTFVIADDDIERKAAPTAVKPAPRTVTPKETKRPDATRLLKPDLGSCADPAVRSIDFRIVSRTAQFRGNVEIVAEVKNLGTVPYRSAAGQQSVQLYETPMGGRSTLVAQRSFVNLEPGQTVTVSHRRSWDASSPAEGEFPPNYLAIISYDPDIRMDNNAANDDCNMENNRKERSGSDVNSMFR